MGDAIVEHCRIHFELGISRLTGADEKVLQMESELQLLQPQVLEKAEVLYITSVIPVMSSCFCLPCAGSGSALTATGR